VRSIRFATPPAVTYQEFTDTLMHFTVNTAQQKDAFEKLIRKMSRYKAKDKPYKTLRENRAFIESMKSDEVVTVSYIRYGKYTRFKDSADYWSDIIDDYNPDSSRIILSSKMYAQNGFDIYEIDYTDTGCSMAIKEKNMQRNGILYVVRTTYNPVKGLSEFGKKFFETFTPKDTLIGGDIFGPNANLFITDLNSADSATRAEAREMLNYVNIKDADYKNWTAVLDTLQPTNEGYFNYKSKMIEELWDVKTPACIKYLKGIYEKAGDTNTFQLSVLKTLLNMETKESYTAFKDLLIGETPLGNQYEINSLFWNIDDSLELTATLYPDMLKLFTLDEYKERVIKILSGLVDSNKVNQQVYKDYLPAIINEAKNEVKRQTANEVEEENDDNNYNYYGRNSYYASNSDSYLGSLASILVSQYEDKTVKGIFDKLLQTKDDDLRTKVAIKLAKNNHPVHDTIWGNIAKSYSARVALYRQLEKNKLSDKFPAKYKTQDSMARALILNNVNTGYKKADSVVLLEKRFVNYQNDTGYVYFYKYHFKENDSWRLAMVGLQPADSNKVNISTKYFNIKSSLKIDGKVPVEKMINVILKEEMIAIAKGFNYSYEDYYYEDEEYYDEASYDYED
jgi:hypothetical protein